MRLDKKLTERLTPAQDTDPRDDAGAQVIDLATRNVLPSVTQRKPGAEGLGLAAGVAFVALLGGLTLWGMDSARNGSTAPAPAPATDTVAQQPAVTIPEIENAPALPPEAITPAPGVQPQAPPPQSVLALAPEGDMAAATGTSRLSSPTVVFDSVAMPEAGGPAAAAVAATAGNGNDDFAGRVGGIGGGTATATAMTDPRTTVTQGTLIPAILETAIDTDIPGFTRAVVSADVRSFDGSRVLVPRSSRLIGQYKSGLQAGQKRAYVIWTRLIRPDGVSVNLGSPAITFGGETGLPGRVNSHFFERFGSAMLLSVIGGLSALGGGGATAVIGSGGQSAAATAVGQTGQIGPTIRVRQGEPIRVFTARDLDFSTVTTR